MKIALANARPYLGGLTLAGMPFAFNVLQLLIDEGHQVDLFLGEHAIDEYESIAAKPNVRLVQCPVLHPLLYRSWLKWMFFRNRARPDYDVVFGVGQVGICFAHDIAKCQSTRLVTFNDEFPSTYQRSHWTEKEAEAYRDSNAIVIPDVNRIAYLKKEVAGLEDSTIVELPNSPMNVQVSADDWHERLSLPDGARYLVHAGGLGPVNRTMELLRHVANWKSSTFLVMRPFPQAKYGFLKAEIDQLGELNRVKWLLEPLSEPELNSLIAQAHASVVIYKDIGAPTRAIGKSSGRLMRSLYLGVPALLSRLDGFEFVEEQGLGVLFDQFDELDQGISAVDGLRQNCQRFAADHCFRETWETVRGSLLPS